MERSFSDNEGSLEKEIQFTQRQSHKISKGSGEKPVVENELETGEAIEENDSSLSSIKRDEDNEEPDGFNESSSSESPI